MYFIYFLCLCIILLTISDLGSPALALSPSLGNKSSKIRLTWYTKGWILPILVSLVMSLILGFIFLVLIIFDSTFFLKLQIRQTFYISKKFQWESPLSQFCWQVSCSTFLIILVSLWF